MIPPAQETFEADGDRGRAIKAGVDLRRGGRPRACSDQRDGGAIESARTTEQEPGALVGGRMKTKVAFYWCASCGGCEEAVLDLGEDLLKVLDAVGIVF